MDVAYAEPAHDALDVERDMAVHAKLYTQVGRLCHPVQGIGLQTDALRGGRGNPPSSQFVSKTSVCPHVSV